MNSKKLQLKFYINSNHKSDWKQPNLSRKSSFIHTMETSHDEENEEHPQPLKMVSSKGRLVRRKKKTNNTTWLKDPSIEYLSKSSLSITSENTNNTVEVRNTLKEITDPIIVIENCGEQLYSQKLSTENQSVKESNHKKSATVDFSVISKEMLCGKSSKRPSRKGKHVRKNTEFHDPNKLFKHHDMDVEIIPKTQKESKSKKKSKKNTRFQRYSNHFEMTHKSIIKHSKNKASKDSKESNAVFDKEFEKMYLSRSKSKDNHEIASKNAAPNGILLSTSNCQSRDQHRIYPDIIFKKTDKSSATGKGKKPIHRMKTKKIKKSAKDSKTKRRQDRLRPLCNTSEKKKASSITTTPRRISTRADTNAHLIHKSLLENIKPKQTHVKRNSEAKIEKFWNYTKFLSTKDNWSSFEQVRARNTQDGKISKRKQSFNNFIFGCNPKDFDRTHDTGTQTMSELDRFIQKYGKQGINQLQKTRIACSCDPKKCQCNPMFQDLLLSILRTY
ncbi:unnamed protein product [Moneuplotes crassus]|uniref:Uncharacterized protein n=1 Tax=Euplotes crassus TaxID=5936 RepID=A0AAD1U534_EUPCR|nr:unnamed protein product [Moneuplotes crassus]